MRSYLFVLPVFFFSLAVSAGSSDQSNTKPAELISELLSAEPIERIDPKYPVSAARKGQEGWVQLSFVIDKEGKVVDPVVEDSSGVRSFEKQALKALKKWRYSPATEGGQPVEQCQSKVRLDFRLTQDKPGIRRKFAAQFRNINEVLDKGDFPKGAELISALRDNGIWNRYEGALLEVIDAHYAKLVKDYPRWLTSVKKALAYSYSYDGETMLNEDAHYGLVSERFKLEVELGQYQEAINTWQELDAIERPVADKLVVKLAPIYQQVQGLVAGQSPLFRPGQITKDGLWWHSLARKHFSFAEINGQLDSVEVRCSNKRMRYSMSESSEWQIPASWQQCKLLVRGEAGSQFKLVELSPPA